MYVFVAGISVEKIGLRTNCFQLNFKCYLKLIVLPDSSPGVLWNMYETLFRVLNIYKKWQLLPGGVNWVLIVYFRVQAGSSGIWGSSSC